MTTSLRLPIRVRVTAAFAAVMLLLLVAIGVLAYVRMSAALLDEIDSGLRFRANAVAHTAAARSVAVPDPRLQEPREAFEQFVSRDDSVLRATRGFESPLLGADELSRVTRPTFFERDVRGVADRARLLALPLTGSGTAAFVVVGASMSDRSDALHELVEVLLIGGPVAVAIACVAAWIVAGWALHPVERMRQQAAAITASGLDRRMTVPRTRDELHRLARTLNGMLDRLDRAAVTERSFLERASHELRTPLAALRAETDLALRRRRTAEELTAALRSVSEETDRLARLADDLLVLARAGNGRLPVHREVVDLRNTVESAAGLFTARALEIGVTLAVDAPNEPTNFDPLRIRQVLVNLLDNALRHTPRGGTVTVIGEVTDTATRIAVSDTGPGIANSVAEAAAGTTPASATAGLGLRIVHAVATGHGGTVHIASVSTGGGALVEIVLPRGTGSS